MASFMEAIFVMDQRANPFLGRRVAFLGKLGGMTLREATALVRRLGGTPVTRDDHRIDLIVLGAEELGDQPGPSEPVGGHQADTLTETELWQQLGLLEDCQIARKLYTPAMLADLLDVPVATIRRWHRTGLIQPRQTVHRLPYFAFEEIAVAQRLVELVENGASADAIEARLQELARHWPGVNRPLADLAVQVEGRRLLIKRGDAILEAHGQQRFDFAGESEADAATIPIRLGQVSEAPHTPEQLVAQAQEHEDGGDLAEAADLYRSALVTGGANPQICFQLAECLYRLGDLSAARERYAMAIELDDTFLEARANLGCVLAELGQTDLAIAAFQGSLALHADYADAHYHLAQLLSAAGRTEEAEQHRQRFEELAPASPWLNAAPHP